MTITYNTGNPLGSTSPKDLSDNASTFDELVGTTAPSVDDRFGKRRLSWAGAEYQWQQMLAASGFEVVHLTYVDGSPLVVSRASQLIDRGGLSYRVKMPSLFPVNLTGTWATDQNLLVEVTDAALRQQLADINQGAALVAGATRQVKTLAALATTVARYDGDQASLIEVVPGGVLGPGLYMWNSTSTATPSARAVAVTGVPTGRWLIQDNVVRAAQWGMIPNSPAAAAANSAAIQAALNSAGVCDIELPRDDTFFVTPDVIKMGSYTGLAGNSLNGSLKGTKLVAVSAGAIISFDNAAANVEFTRIRQVSFEASVAGVTAIKGLNLARYVSTLEVTNCNFYASLEECLYGNFIFLNCNTNTFGYLGAVIGGKHRHIYCKGDTGGATANANVVHTNRFYRGVGNPEAVMFRGGFQLDSRNNNYEQMACRPIGLYGVTQANFRKDWFEVATNCTEFVYVGQNPGDPNVYNTQGTTFDSCWFENAPSGVFLSLVEIGTGGATVGFVNPGGTNCDGVAFTRRNGVINGGISQFLDFGSFFGAPLYPSKVTGGHSFIAPLSPSVSTRGYVDKPWFDGWDVSTNLQGWNKTAVTSWVGGLSGTDFGTRITITTSSSGSNVIWRQAPWAYFAGKVIAIRARGRLASGTGDTMQLAAGVSNGIPGDVPAIGTAALYGFDSTMKDVLGAFYVDPSNPAVYLNVGIRSGGFAGTVEFEAFDFWILGGDFTPEFAR